MATCKATSPFVGGDGGVQSSPLESDHQGRPVLLNRCTVSVRPKLDQRHDSFVPVFCSPDISANGLQLLSFQVLARRFRPRDVPPSTTYTVTVEVGAEPIVGSLAWIAVEENRPVFAGQTELQLVLCEAVDRFRELDGPLISRTRRPFCIGPVVQELIASAEVAR